MPSREWKGNSMTLAHAGYVGGSCWLVRVGDETRVTDAGVMVVDIARDMGATHVRFLDVYAADGSIHKDPFPAVRELCEPEVPVSL